MSDVHNSKSVDNVNHLDALDYAFGLPMPVVVLGAIIPDGAIETRAYPKGSKRARQDALAWITEWQAKGANIYFKDCSVGIPKTWHGHDTPTKEDCTELFCAHADFDVKDFHDVAKDPAGFAAKKQTLLEHLSIYKPMFSEVIDTGNGYQVRWYLDTPTKDGDAIEAINRRLAADLGGDPECVDRTHWYRLPSTTNYPNKKKQGLGRVMCKARIQADLRHLFRYRLDELPTGIVVPKAEVVASVGVVAAEDFDDALSKLAPDFRQLIEKGPPDMAKGTRSTFTYHVAAKLREAGFTDGQIVGVITTPGFAASEHIMDQKQRKPEAQASRVIDDLNRKGVTRAPSVEEAFGEYSDKSPSPAETKLRSESASGIISKRLSDYEMQNVDYLWEGRLALGKQTLLSGVYGTGKGQIAAYIMARVTTGTAWYDGAPASKKGRVLVLAAEDGVGDTIKPRVVAAGGDPDMVEVIEGVKDKNGVRRFSLIDDIKALEEKCKELGDVVLIIIDPASSYMGRDVKSSSNATMRAILDPIKEFAERANVAVLSITHNRKAREGSAGDRIMDSVAFPASARAAFMTFQKLNEDKQPTGTMQMLLVKTNLPGTPACGLEYEIVGVEGGKFAHGTLIDKRGKPVKAAYITWTGRTGMSADDAVRAETTRPRPAFKEAVVWLNEYLTEHGPTAPKIVIAAANEAGITTHTLKETKRELGVVAIPDDSVPPVWVWDFGNPTDDVSEDDIS